MKKMMKRIACICLCAALFFNASMSMAHTCTSPEEDYLINLIFTH